MNQNLATLGMAQGIPPDQVNMNLCFPVSNAQAVGVVAHASRLLVVDDDQDIRQLCANVLVRFGYRVDTAADGAVGWSLLNTVNKGPESYDLLITDNSMPKVSGLDLIRDLRVAQMTLPVILVSGAFPAVMEAAIVAGTPLKHLEWNRPLQISAALLKPFTTRELLQTVNAVLLAAREPFVGGTSV